MIFSKVNSAPLKWFMAFVLMSELVHVSINTSPPTSLRLVYIVVYFLFCASYVKLIPIFTAINLITERFSTIFGEFLPNTLWFHIAILLFGYIQLRHTQNPAYRGFDRQNWRLLVLFALYIFANTMFYGNISFLLSITFSIVYLLVLNLTDDEYIQPLINCIIITMCCSCLISLYNYDNLVADYATSSGDTQRLAWKDSNYLSFFIGIVFLLSAFKYSRTSKSGEKRFYLIVLSIFFICLTLLVSRGAILSLGIALAFYYKKAIFSPKIVGIAICAGLVFMLALHVGLLDNVIRRFMSEDMSSGSGRTVIWAAGLGTFLQKDTLIHLFGAGCGAADRMASLSGILFSPHNNFLQILFDFGAVGLFLFLGWWLLLFINSHTTEKRTLIIFILVNSMTIVPLYYVTPIWIIIPLLLVWDERINHLIYG